MDTDIDKELEIADGIARLIALWLCGAIFGYTVSDGSWKKAAHDYAAEIVAKHRPVE